MKLATRLTNVTLHTRILRGILGLIVISIIVMLVRQQQGTIVDQHWEHTTIEFIGTTGDNPISLEVDIADTDYKREYGLMFRGQINWGKGMLFVFDDEQMRSFWMKNTYIPLDMVFLNASGTIVSIHVGAKPTDETPISSKYPAKYVIEANSGWTIEAGLKPGMGINMDMIRVRYIILSFKNKSMLTTLGIVLFGFVMGAVMGSFGLVLLDRWEDLKSMVTGRSMCLSCKHPLAIKDLIPLGSYLSTGGKCRYCDVKIPVSCPLMELAMGAVFALTAGWVMSLGGDNLAIHLIAWWMINWALTLLVVHDHNTHYLHWVAWIVACIVAVGYTLGRHSDVLMACVWSSLILGAVFLLVYGSGFAVHWIKYGTRQEGFGFGDVLTALLIGWIAPLALGYNTLNTIGEGGVLTLVQLVLGYLVASSTIGLLYRGYLWSRGDQEIEIAFIPGMVIGFWIYIVIILQFGLFV